MLSRTQILQRFPTLNQHHQQHKHVYQIPDTSASRPHPRPLLLPEQHHPARPCTAGQATGVGGPQAGETIRASHGEQAAGIPCLVVWEQPTVVPFMIPPRRKWALGLPQNKPCTITTLNAVLYLHSLEELASLAQTQHQPSTVTLPHHAVVFICILIPPTKPPLNLSLFPCSSLSLRLCTVCKAPIDYASMMSAPYSFQCGASSPRLLPQLSRICERFRPQLAVTV